MGRRAGYDAYEEIKQILYDLGPSTWAQLLHYSGVSKSTLSKKINRLIEEGNVTVAIGKDNKKIYILTEGKGSSSIITSRIFEVSKLLHEYDSDDFETFPFDFILYSSESLPEVRKKYISNCLDDLRENIQKIFSTLESESKDGVYPILALNVWNWRLEEEISKLNDVAVNVYGGLVKISEIISPLSQEEALSYYKQWDILIDVTKNETTIDMMKSEPTNIFPTYPGKENLAPILPETRQGIIQLALKIMRAIKRLKGINVE